jgi:hypothetical protein
MRIDAEVEDAEEVELGTVHNRACVGLFFYDVLMCLFSFRRNGTSLYPFVLHHNRDKIMDGWRFRIERLWLYDDVDRLHIKIDNLNDPLVGLCFIRSMDGIWPFP